MHTEISPIVPTKRRPWLAAGFLMLGTLMNILDATIVNLALPAIREDLGAGPGALQWVLVIYILTFGACLLPFGRFGDIFGRRNTLLRHRGFIAGVGMLMFTISGMAGTMVVLAIFLQSGRGLSPAKAGLAMAVHPIGAMVASLTSGRLGSRGLPLRVLGGLPGLFAGLFWLRIVSGYGTSGSDFIGPLLLPTGQPPRRDGSGPAVSGDHFRGAWA